MNNKTQIHTALKLALSGLFALAVMFFAATPAHATLIASEDFDGYTAGASLADQNSGTGWGGAWTVGNVAAVVTLTDNPADRISYTLNDGTVLGSGTSGMALMVSSTATSSSFDVPHSFSREIANPVTTGEDMFVSFIFKVKNTAADDGTTQSSGNIMLQWFAKSASTTNTTDASGFTAFGGEIGARVNNSSAVTSPARNRFASKVVYGRTYFMVIKYTGWDGTSYKTTRVWINPTTNDEASQDATVTVADTQTAGGSAQFRGVRIRTNGVNSAGRYQIVDAIRIGTTWADVVGEPTLQPPTVTSITPTADLHPGDTITIEGTNFTSATTVTIGGIAVTPTFDADTPLTKMTVVIPAAAVGSALPVVIINAGGEIATPPTIAVTAAPPQIDSIIPSSLTPGSTFTISGTHLATTTSVTIGSYSATLGTITDTMIPATLPAGVPLGNYTLTVTTAGGNATQPITVALLPTVVSVSPVKASPGEIISLIGDNFEGATVTIGGVKAYVVAEGSDAGTLNVIVPDGTTSSEIVLTTEAGSSTVTAGLFTVAPPAELLASDNFDDAAYAAGAVGGQNGGTGWSGAWNGASNSFTLIDDMPIEYTLDDGTKLGGGRVLRLGATSNAAISRAISEPVLDGRDIFVSFIFQVRYGPAGTTFAGSNVYASWGAATDLGVATFDAASAGTAGLIGSGGKVGARVKAGSTVNGMIDAPLIKSQEIYFYVIKYTGWDGTRYTKCQIWLNPGVNDEGTTDAGKTAIASNPGNGSPGFRGLGVRTNTLSSTNCHIYDAIRIGTSWNTVVSDPKPIISDVSPLTDIHPGDVIAIKGAAFRGVTKVTIGGVEATIVDYTNATIKAMIPAGTDGADKTVVVTTVSGEVTATQKLNITLTLPAITTVSNFGETVAHGQSLTINGEYFTGLTAVTVGGIPAVIRSSTNSEIKIKLPASGLTSGPASVVVTTAGGSATLSNAYTIDASIKPVPVMTGASIENTTAKAGDRITITGENFIQPATVKINGVVAQVVSVVDEEIIAIMPEGVSTTDETTIEVQTDGGTVSVNNAWVYATMPVIIENPVAAQNAVTTKRVNIVTSATGTLDLTYQWQYKTLDTGIWLPVSGSDYTGATTGTVSVLATNKNTMSFRAAVSTRMGTVYSSTTTLTVMDNLLPAPSGLAISTGTDSTIYVSDTTQHAVQTIATSGSVTLLAGQPATSGTTDGTGTAAHFNKPRGLSLNSAGVLLVADSGNNLIRSVTAAGAVTTAGTGTDAVFHAPAGLASLSTSGGATYVADTENHLIKKIAATGEVSIVAGSGTAGDVNGALLDSAFNAPASVAVDVTGSYVYVADTKNNAIRLIDLTAGLVSTFAASGTTAGHADGDALTEASFNAPADLVVDDHGDVYVADTGNSRIRLITTDTATTTRVVITLAGNAAGFKDGTGTNAWFRTPAAIALHGSDIYVADTGNGVIRRIAADEPATVTTLQVHGAPAAPTPPPDLDPHGFPDNGNDVGGGGAPSFWFLGAFALLALAHLRRRR